MKLINLILFIVIMNMFSAAAVELPDNTINPVNAGNPLFDTSGTDTDSAIYDEAQEDKATQDQYQYNQTLGEQTSEVETLWGRFLQLGRSLLTILDHILFGLSNLISMAIGSPEAGPAFKIIRGLKVVMGAMWTIIIVYFFRGLSVE